MSTGLLDAGDREQALYQGLLTLGAGLMGNGPSRMPVSSAGMFGNAAGGFSQAYRQSLNDAMSGRARKLQLEEIERQRTDREKQEAAYQGMFTPPPMAPNMTGGPTRANAAAMPKSPVEQLGLTPQQIEMLRAMPAAQGLQILNSRAFAERPRPLTVKPGEHVVDPQTFAPLYTAPATDRAPKLGDVRKIDQGDAQVTQEWDGQAWKQVGAGPRWQPDQSLETIPDQSSPTGFRRVPRAQALNQPAMGPSGLSIDFDETGRPKSIMSGPGGGRTNPGNPANLSPKTVGELEESANASNNQIARLTQIEAGFKPEYLEIVPRGQMAWNSLRERAGVGLSEPQRRQLAEYTAFKRDTLANLNQTIKDTTGAAMSEPEAKRIIATMPSTGSGIFDGDSPTEFQAKLQGATRATRNALLRSNYARMNGLDPLKTGISLEEVPALVERRGTEIERMVRTAMPEAEDVAVLQEVRKRLGREFGMVR